MIDVGLVVLARYLQTDAGAEWTGQIHAVETRMTFETCQVAGGNRFDADAVQAVGGSLEEWDHARIDLYIVEQKILITRASQIDFFLGWGGAGEIVDFLGVKSGQVLSGFFRKRGLR